MNDEIKNPSQKILIVEDDEISRRVMYLLLKNYFQIDLVKNGKEAIDLFLQNNYQLILMDINLGIGKNGIDVMQEIRKSEEGKAIYIIAITAYSNFGDREAFLSSGFDNYISKPYNPDDLVRSVLDSINIYNN
jgi:CheY-like chemotaxis protein